MILLVIDRPEAWERFVERVQDLPRDKRGYVLLVRDEGVTRCLGCEPGLFPHFHQFVLDGGRAAIGLNSLKRFGIPETRPPELFERVDEEALEKELLSRGYRRERL
ncbi:hypothetical protein FVE67_03545 [Thermosulfurimonas marina]|uniref:Uncharacterized protein n=1 Tax=Thermosulfurimonas marina TaxID=2047767 RepID=A0A6H1WS19_9BACT|nr:hypothetical protein [Thermosulfurimonas marina]QJA05926.1 hypothetical protein FVE67_03545 [Thermosulfurimonas marina]